MGKQNTSDNSYIPGIDGLRAIAVLSVVLYHLDRDLLPGGFTGVDVFFVISGYVISKSLARSDAATLATFILGFYERRILRIVPALLAFLLVTSIFSVLFVPDGWLSASNNSTAMAAFFGISNLFLVRSADGYFSARIDFNPFIHTWSLAVEEQFYLIFPFIFYAWLRVARSGSPSRITAAILPLIAVVSLGFAWYGTRTAQVHAFYLLPSRFWELACGALLYQLEDLRCSRGMKLKKPSWWLLCGFSFTAVGFLYSEANAFPFPWALFPVVGTVFMIAGTVNASESARGLQIVLRSRAMTYIGRISYSLYLWHWGVFTLFRWTVGLAGPPMIATALLLSFALASLSYHVVEMPFRKTAYIRHFASWKIVAMGLAAVVMSYPSMSSASGSPRRMARAARRPITSGKRWGGSP